jgi:hypothetical protein
MQPFPLLRRPRSTSPLQIIGNSLQAQYEVWQPKARYRQALDPTADELRKLCLSLRRQAGREERVLFHYNGIVFHSLESLLFIVIHYIVYYYHYFARFLPSCCLL